METRHAPSLSSLFAVVGSLFLNPGLHAQPATPTPFQQRVLTAMQGDIRTPEERARDVNRLPAEILSFFRMREDMRVIEILPAGGWFTKILAPVLKDEGKLYVTHPEGRYAQRSAHREPAGPREGRGDRLGATGGGSEGPSALQDIGTSSRRHGSDLPQLSQLLAATAPRSINPPSTH